MVDGQTLGRHDHESLMTGMRHARSMGGHGNFETLMTEMRHARWVKGTLSETLPHDRNVACSMCVKDHETTTT